MRAPDSTQRAGIPARFALPAVLLLWGVCAALNSWWVLRFRVGYPLDVDEAGYMAAAYDDSTALLQHGLQGLLHAYRTPAQFGPFVPLFTIPVHLFLGRDIYTGLFVDVPFLLLLLVALYHHLPR